MNKCPFFIPKIFSIVESVFHLFIVKVEDRNSLLNFLKDQAIFTDINYPLSIHK